MSTKSNLSDQIQSLKNDTNVQIQLPSGETLNTGKNKPIESTSGVDNQLEVFKKVPTIDLPEDESNGENGN